MMIRKLDEQVINKIAAGEVVERPASVIKELVENSIDAGSTKIVIEVRDGGKRLIRISDNGCGIKADELKTAILPHTTSKISSAEDLFDIHTLGFRGEALASINAVSKMEITSKTADESVGAYFVSDGFNDGSIHRVGAPDGTTIVVKDLFYNTPVRKKFLKSNGVELSYITDLVQRLALSNPQISFKFVSNNDVKLHTSGDKKLYSVIKEIYGKSVAEKLIEIDYENLGIKIKGFLGKPEINRGNKIYENYFINGRYVKSKIIERAVENGFKERLMKNRFPFAILHLELDRKRIDVNVHPNKLEVRFDDENLIYDNVYKATHDALADKEYIINIVDKKDLEEEKTEQIIEKQDEIIIQEKFDKKEEISIPVESKVEVFVEEKFKSSGKEVFSEESARFDFEINEKHVKVNEDESFLDTSSKEDNEDVYIDVLSPIKEEVQELVKVEQETIFGLGENKVEQETFLAERSIKKHKIIGQLFDTYWIVEMENKMYMIDQHAAHEKVIYEKLIKNYESGKINSQALLFPVVLDLNQNMMAYLEEHFEEFNKLGFDIEKFGEEDYILRAVPYLLNDSLDESSLISLMDEMIDYNKDRAFNIYLDSLATVACKAAIKGNDRISTMEFEGLMDELLELDNPYNCPHGRPVMIVFDRKKIEKDFKRIV